MPRTFLIFSKSLITVKSITMRKEIIGQGVNFQKEDQMVQSSIVFRHSQQLKETITLMFIESNEDAPSLAGLQRSVLKIPLTYNYIDKALCCYILDSKKMLMNTEMGTTRLCYLNKFQPQMVVPFLSRQTRGWKTVSPRFLVWNAFQRSNN